MDVAEIMIVSYFFPINHVHLNLGYFPVIIVQNV